MTFTPKDKLEQVFEKQLELQTRITGSDPSTLSEEEKIQYIRIMVLALDDELHEALAEISWKPWASAHYINRDAYVSELIDAMHFLVNLFLVAGCDAREVAGLYAMKSAKNHKRQNDGYDGISTKCPVCRRALDDEFVTCDPERLFCGWGAA